jgi:hypothetical protein
MVFAENFGTAVWLLVQCPKIPSLLISPILGYM